MGKKKHSVIQVDRPNHICLWIKLVSKYLTFIMFYFGLGMEKSLSSVHGTNEEPGKFLSQRKGKSLTKKDLQNKRIQLDG